MLASIHRSVGIDEWIALGDPDRPDPGLERVLGALDMFVLDEGAADIEEVTCTAGWTRVQS